MLSRLLFDNPTQLMTRCLTSDETLLWQGRRPVSPWLVALAFVALLLIPLGVRLLQRLPVGLWNKLIAILEASGWEGLLAILLTVTQDLALPLLASGAVLLLAVLPWWILLGQTRTRYGITDRRLLRLRVLGRWDVLSLYPRDIIRLHPEAADQELPVRLIAGGVALPDNGGVHAGRLHRWFQELIAGVNPGWRGGLGLTRSSFSVNGGQRP